MSAIDIQNAKSIRDSMLISVKVGDPSDPLFEFDNETIISCQLELRSDLKPIDPTLPESEITIMAYYPEDISEEVITIDNDTVITYQAGYTGDMSPVRTFYLSEQMQWEKNVLTIKGVDAVHFLDISAPPLFLGSAYAEYISLSFGGYDERWHGAYDAHAILWASFIWYIESVAGVTLTSAESKSTLSKSTINADKVASVIERGSVRDIVANLMNLCHQEYESGYFSGGTTFWLTYVDAGRPKVLAKKPSSSWTINEVDCGEIKRHIDKNIVQIKAENKRLDISMFRGWPSPYGGTLKDNQKVGSVEIFQNKGGGYSYDCLASVLQLAIPKNDSTATNPSYIITWAAPSSDGRVLPSRISWRSTNIGVQLRDATSNGWQNWNTSWSGVGYSYDLSDIWQSLTDAGYEGVSKGSFTAELQGGAYNLTKESDTYTKTGSGVMEAPSKTSWAGQLCAGKYSDSTSIKKILPDEGFKSLMNRSQETGSFVWKGDPRMQPRDVITFTYRDGTTELRTIETISLKHEGGGTVATITYRKGIV